ncbi:MAG: hypothetical protein ACYCXF_03635 [Thermoleophilia bacterium]
MKVKAMILLVIFIAVLYLPFSFQAASGDIFNGLPLPHLNATGAPESGSAGSQYGDSATQAQYGGDPNVSVVNSTSAQYGVDINYMRNHMNVLKQPGQSTKQCAACHTDRASFCDRCHKYVGINPTIEY